MNSEDFYPILKIVDDVHGGVIIGKDGTISYMVEIEQPEVYSLSCEEIINRHTVYQQAFSHMPDFSYIHKQDLFRVVEYSEKREYGSYLSSCDEEYFHSRPYMIHITLLTFTLSGLKSLRTEYVSNIFSYSESYSKEDLYRIETFISAIEFAVNNLVSIKSKIKFLNSEEIKKKIIISSNFFEEKGLQDIQFDSLIRTSKMVGKMIALTDVEFFPQTLPVAKVDNSVSQDKSELYMSPAEGFGGIHLFQNHIYNQVIYFYSDKVLKAKLRKALDECIANRGWDKVNFPVKIKKLQELIQDIQDKDELLCKVHSSILLFDKNEEKLDIAEKELRSKLDIHNIQYYIPANTNLFELYRSTIPGNIATLSNEYMFTASLSFAVGLFTHYSSFRNDEEGIYFNERLHNTPLIKDIWDSKKKRIKARNSVVIAPTGGGKSYFVNNIIHQMLDGGYTVVAVEFGNSFKQLCYLYPDISIHVEYDPSMPLGINPFDLGDKAYTPEREETLVSMCLRFWKRPAADSNLLVAFKKFLALYYKSARNERSFQDFYRFLTEGYENICSQTDVKKEYFDIDSFKHVCSEMMPGGAYANLVATQGVASGLSEKRFIHFELTKVKASPFVASIVMAMLFDVINEKILSDPSKRGYIVFDEYAETAQMKSASSLDVDIHQAVAFFYQKIRKENGAVMTIIQSPVQLPDNEYTKGIIANTQLLYVLEGTEVVYDAVVETFKIRNKAQIAQMKSLKNNYSCSTPYSECWIRFGESYALTVRLETSPKKFLAFQTEGEKRAALDELYKNNGNNMKEAIEEYYLTTKKLKS